LPTGLQVTFAAFSELVVFALEFITPELCPLAVLYSDDCLMTVLACIAVAMLTLTVVSRRTDS
jgi:hypothetical protein